MVLSKLARFHCPMESFKHESQELLHREELIPNTSLTTIYHSLIIINHYLAQNCMNWDPKQQGTKQGTVCGWYVWGLDGTSLERRSK